MFDHPVAGMSPAVRVKQAGLSPGAVVGGVGGAHGAVRSGGGGGSAIAGGLVGTLVGDAVYAGIARAFLGHADEEVRKSALPVAVLAAMIAGQISGRITKNWLLGDAKKEKRDA